MTELIVCGHGKFASGISESLEMIAGDLKNYHAIDFKLSDSTDVLAEKIEKAIEANEDKETIILCDLAGGSPFRTAVEVGYPKGCEVVAGCNLGMLLEINSLRNTSMSAKELAYHAEHIGKDSVMRFEFKPAKKKTDFSNGI